MLPKTILIFFLTLLLPLITSSAFVPVDTIQNHLRIGTVPTKQEVSRENRNLQNTHCASRKQVIAPIVAQNTEGRLKFLVQQNVTHSSIQEIEIAACVQTGSLCSACQEEGEHASKMVCSNTDKEIRLIAKGNYGRSSPWHLHVSWWLCLFHCTLIISNPYKCYCFCYCMQIFI